MRDLTLLDIWRSTETELHFAGTIGDHTCGAFLVPVGNVKLNVIASNGEGWDHVSVSARDRTPTWDEMEAIKRMFFKDTETAMQLHVPPKQHINYHPYCLHLWRPHDNRIPLPPQWMVGPK
jgi:hypothetical protein